MNAVGMLARDHPLNELGVNQAQNLNDAWKAASSENKVDDKVQSFMAADVAFASPLTRATQTAVVALAGHPTVAKSGLKLLRSVREVKNIGGLDTLGVAVGDAIAVRVRTELAKIVGDETAAGVRTICGQWSLFCCNDSSSLVCCCSLCCS